MNMDLFLPKDQYLEFSKHILYVPDLLAGRMVWPAVLLTMQLMDDFNYLQGIDDLIRD